MPDSSEKPSPARHFPVRPQLELLRQQARDRLHAMRRGEIQALEELRRFHPKPPVTPLIRLGDAQLVLARSYGLESWTRLVLACRLTDAIWHGDVAAVHALVAERPHLLVEDARGVPGNWGPPMSYAANLGQDAIVDLLYNLGAPDLQLAFERACLQGQLATARHLFAMGARPVMGSVMGPCETLSGSGLALLLDMGSPLLDKDGDALAPVALMLETYCRNPEGKHACLALAQKHGVTLPNTAPMALHRGRIDLLSEHLRRDHRLLRRTFTHEEIFPPELGCHADPTLALHGTPLAGGTLLHMAVDYDEMKIAQWLLDEGIHPNTPAAIDKDGFGGHTALFGCVVSQPWRTNRGRDAEFAQLLLDHGANPNVRASLKKQLRFVNDETLHSYRDVTPLGWGRRFHDKDWVSTPVMKLLEQSGGRE